MNDDLSPVISLLGDLQEDNTVPRNVKVKLGTIQSVLESPDGELSLKINKVLSVVEEIANDINLPMFVRTQIWHLTSMLESMNSQD